MHRFQLKRVLQPEYEKIGLEIAKCITSFRSEDRLFFSVPLSLFLDPFAQSNPTIRSHCFYCFASFLVGTENDRFAPRLAILISEEPDAEHAREALDAYMFPYVMISLIDGPNRIGQTIHEALDENPTNEKVGRNFGSMPQLLFSRNLRADFGELVEDGWISIFEEIAVRAAIDLLPSEISSGNQFAHGDMQRDAEELIGLCEYGKKSSFDVLITYSSPDYFPFLAIEYDGDYHLEPKQRVIDEKKERICELSGLPLVRVTAQFLREPPVGSHGLKAMQKTVRAEMIGFLIIQFFVVAGAWRRLLKVRDSIPAQYRLGDKVFFKSALEELSPNWGRNWEENKESILLAEEFRALAGKHLNVEFQPAVQGGRSIATMTDPTGRQRGLETPWIDLKLTGHSLLNAEDLLKEFCKMYVLKQGIQIFKASTAK